MINKKFQIDIDNIDKSEDICLTEDLNNEFLLVDRQVFISHSHKEEDVAITLKDKLASYKITSFVDSTEWRSMNDIVKQDGFFTKEVEDKLIQALKDQIKKSDYFVFINSKFSIDERDQRTSSFYIYTELQQAILNESYGVGALLAELTPVKNIQQLITLIKSSMIS